MNDERDSGAGVNADSAVDSEPVVRTRYSDDDPVSEAVVRALAAAKGVDPIELGPLYDSIEPDALDAIIGDPVIDDAPPTVVEFLASGYRVVVSSDGWITVFEA